MKFYERDKVMSRYEEFMGKGPIRSFASGIHKPVENTLKNVFEKKSEADMSPERMERLKATLRKSKIGRETLDFLKANGSGLGFEKMPYYGYFSPEENRVAISPDFSDEDLVITLVHEIRHAKQDSIMHNTTPDMVPATMFKNGFMIEADACAAECVLAHEMMEQGDDSIFKAHQKTAYGPMSTAFEAEFDKSHDWNKARSAAMLEWYHLPVKPGYANQYIDFMGEIAKDKDKEGQKIYFQHAIPTQKMSDKLCIDSKGTPYLQNPKMLDLPERINLNEKQAKKLSDIMRPYMRKSGKTAEKLGLDKVFVKHADGSFTTMADQVKADKAKNKNNAQAVAAAKGRRGGR